MARVSKDKRRDRYICSRLIEMHRLWVLSLYTSKRLPEKTERVDALYEYATNLVDAHNYIVKYGPEFEGDPSVEAEIKELHELWLADPDIEYVL